MEVTFKNKISIVPQRTLMLNGHPAFKAGEWPGILSSRFKGSKLILKQEDPRNLKRSFSGRRHFILKESVELPHRIQQKIFKEREIVDDLNPKPRGRKFIEPDYSEPLLHERKILSLNVKIKEDEIRGKKHVLHLDRTENETIVENQMTRKKRLSNLQAIRNGMQIISPGDKIYKNVDYSPGFFNLEGLVVGSTNTKKYKKSTTKKGDVFYDTLDLNVKSLNPEKLWTSKLLRESIECDSEYVKQLKLWESNFLPQIPKNATQQTNNKKK
jgi:hypothetical protein